jgi:hypothetical protein
MLVKWDEKFYGHLVHFTDNWSILEILSSFVIHIFARFGILYQLKSGTPGPDDLSFMKSESFFTTIWLLSFEQCIEGSGRLQSETFRLRKNFFGMGSIEI